jgi:serine/threonine protein kinase
VLSNQYKLISILGRGSFGEICLGINPDTNEEVAVKLELISAAHP